jgi:hypothetical protein
MASFIPDAPLCGGNSAFFIGIREPGGATVAPLAGKLEDGIDEDLSQMASMLT